MAITSFRNFIILLLVSGLTFMTFLLFLGSQVTGISSDEQIHMLDFRGLRWTSDPTKAHFGSYGLSFQLLSHGVAVLVGVEPLNQVAISPSGFAIRHFVTAALAAGTSVVIGLTVWVVSRQVLLSLWASLAILSVPSFFGHGFFNPKDIPVAFGYSVLTFSAIYYLASSLRRTTLPRFQKFSVMLLTTFGVWILIGVRFAMSYLVLLTVAVTVCMLIFIMFNSKQSFVIKNMVWFLLPVFFGLLLVAGTNPCIVSRSSNGCVWGWELIPRVFGATTEFKWPFQTFLAGQLVAGVDPPFWYLPIAVVAGLPVFLGALALLGFVFYAEHGDGLTKSDSDTRPNHFSWIRMTLLVPVALQMGAGPAAAILLRATIYDSQRQHLYVYPAIVVMAALGIMVLGNWLSNFMGHKRASLASLTFGLSILVLPIYESVRLFPYSYVYVNPAASSKGFAQLWETDYWATSLREALTYVPGGANLEIPVQFWTATPFLPEPRAEGDANNLKQKFVIQMHRVGTGLGNPPKGCDLTHVVSRNLRGEDLPMSYVSRCDLEVSTGSMPYYEIAKQGPYLAK